MVRLSVIAAVLAARFDLDEVGSQALARRCAGLVGYSDRAEEVRPESFRPIIMLAEQAWERGRRGDVPGSSPGPAPALAV